MAEITTDGMGDVATGLANDGLIEAQFLSQGIFILERCEVSEYNIDRITGHKMDHADDDEEHAEAHGNKAAKTFQYEAQQGDFLRVGLGLLKKTLLQR